MLTNNGLEPCPLWGGVSSLPSPLPHLLPPSLLSCLAERGLVVAVTASPRLFALPHVPASHFKSMGYSSRMRL